MAPSTRLRARPELRVSYAANGRDNGQEEQAQSHEPTASTRRATRRPVARKPAVAEEPRKTTSSSRKKAVRVKAGGVAKPKPKPKKAAKAVAEPKDERPKKTECSICATTKLTRRSFKAPLDSCEHFLSICTVCIQNMLHAKVAERQFQEPELSCPFSDCDHALDHTDLKNTVSKAVFVSYDDALIKHTLSTGESFVTCLSLDCGLYFSIDDDCKAKKPGKHMIVCPHCDYESCLACNRPWRFHGQGGCDKVKDAEDQESEETIKFMGAKPCPKCGWNIQKQGGCDHMTCRHCRASFCWQCLVPYSSRFAHRSHCRHARVRLATEPDNWLPDGMTDVQVNEMIRRADARRDRDAPDDPQVDFPVAPVQAPGAAGFPGAAALAPGGNP